MVWDGLGGLVNVGLHGLVVVWVGYGGLVVVDLHGLVVLVA